MHAAVMLDNDIERIVTFDAGFDSVPGIVRHPLRPPFSAAGSSPSGLGPDARDG